MPKLSCTCLPNSGEVQQILEGPEGILTGIKAGALFLDCTSGKPAASVRIAAQLQSRGWTSPMPR